MYIILVWSLSSLASLEVNIFYLFVISIINFLALNHHPIIFLSIITRSSPDLPASVSVSTSTVSPSTSSPIEFHCEASAFPAPSLVWKIVDQMEEEEKEADTIMEEQDGGNMVATADLR